MTEGLAGIHLWGSAAVELRQAPATVGGHVDLQHPLLAPYNTAPSMSNLNMGPTILSSLNSFDS